MADERKRLLTDNQSLEEALARLASENEALQAQLVRSPSPFLHFSFLSRGSLSDSCRGCFGPAGGSAFGETVVERRG